MDQKELIALKNKATELRIRAVDMIWKAQSGHPGGSLSVADFMAACYFRYMKVDPQNPRWEDRDRFVLSKGHVCPAQYAALAMKGFFPMEVLDTLRKEGSPLQGHPSMNKCPGIDISTGSLGQGLACAVGMALAAKLDGKDYRVFSAVGDGECNEGEIWEACGTAHKYKLDNLVVFVDWNGLQLDGTCEEIMPPVNLARKFEAFGFEVYECNGIGRRSVGRQYGPRVGIRQVYLDALKDYLHRRHGAVHGRDKPNRPKRRQRRYRRRHFVGDRILLSEFVKFRRYDLYAGMDYRPYGNSGHNDLYQKVPLELRAHKLYRRYTRGHNARKDWHLRRQRRRHYVYY